MELESQDLEAPEAPAAEVTARIQRAVGLMGAVPEKNARVCYDSLVHFVDAWQEDPPREFAIRCRRSRWEDVVCNEHDVPDQMYLDFESKHIVQQALGVLEHNEALVLIGRFFDELTLDEVGADFGVSGERIRQIEARALRKLRSEYRDSILYDYFAAGRDPKLPRNPDEYTEDNLVPVKKRAKRQPAPPKAPAKPEKPAGGFVDGSWLTVLDVAAQLNVRAEVVEDLMQQGDLPRVPGMRQNWFTPKVVKRYLDKVAGVEEDRNEGFGNVSWLSILDVAARLRVAPSTVQGCIRRGELLTVPGTEQTWITPKALRAFLTMRAQRGRAPVRERKIGGSK